MIAFAASCVVLLFMSVFESTFLSNLFFLPAVPDLSLICVLFFSIHNGKVLGETSGFVSGLFLDFLSACPLGLNCLLRSILGYLGGIFYKTIDPEGFFTPFFLGICATIAKMLLVQFLSFLLPSVVTAYDVISLQFLFEIGMNALISPFVFAFLGIFKDVLVFRPKSTTR